MILKQFFLYFLLPLLLSSPVAAQNRCTESEIRVKVENYEQQEIVDCGSKSLEPLLAIVKQDDAKENSKINAVYFLSIIEKLSEKESEEIINALIPIIKRNDVSIDVRYQTISTLGKIGQDSKTLDVVNALFDLLQQDDVEKRIRSSAFTNLTIIARSLVNKININETELSDRELTEFINIFDKTVKIGRENIELFNLRQEQVSDLNSQVVNLKKIKESSFQVKIINEVKNKGIRFLFIHIGLWVVLIFIYPHDHRVQAIFFWNPKVRNFLGLWYVGLALTWIPFLRNRLFIPFKESLLSDAHLDSFDPDAYFANSQIKFQGSTDTKQIQEVIPEIRGRVILEGESGLGKSMFLRNLALVKSSQRIVVYLSAQNCDCGVIEAIKNKLHGHIKEDLNFLESLIYSGAIDIFIDGLNEVTPDTLSNIVNFVKRYFQGNIILATQPLESISRLKIESYTIQPLKPDLMEQFLLSRKAILPEDALVKGSDYDRACKKYLTTVLSQQQSEEERKAVHRMLSNPMELTVIALMLARKKKPNLLNLQQQQYEIMAEEYDRLYPTKTFPLETFSETVYQMRLDNHESAIPSEKWLDELQCMERHKMVIIRQSDDIEGKSTKKWYFRHDKIQEFFIMQTFLGAQQDNRLTKLISVPRFRGVYFLLAITMPIEDANNLREILIQYAADTKDHTVSDTFIQLVRSRQTHVSMSQLTVVAKIKAKTGSETVLNQQLLQLIAPTLSEQGCLNYDLHRSIEDNSLFLFYENWASKSVWERHMKSQHIKTFQKNAEGMIEDWELLLMKREKVAK